MIDLVDTRPLFLRQLKQKDLTRLLQSVFKLLEKANHRGDLEKIEHLAEDLRMIASHMRQSAGQALVEFALILPIAILLAMGFLNLSMGIHDRQVLQAASTETARYGTMAVSAADSRPTLDQVQAEAIARSAGTILSQSPEADRMPVFKKRIF